MLLMRKPLSNKRVRILGRFLVTCGPHLSGRRSVSPSFELLSTTRKTSGRDAKADRQANCQWLRFVMGRNDSPILAAKFFRHHHRDAGFARASIASNAPGRPAPSPASPVMRSPEPLVLQSEVPIRRPKAPRGIGMRRRNWTLRIPIISMIPTNLRRRLLGGRHASCLPWIPNHFPAAVSGSYDVVINPSAYPAGV